MQITRKLAREIVADRGANFFNDQVEVCDYVSRHYMRELTLEQGARLLTMIRAEARGPGLVAVPPHHQATTPKTSPWRDGGFDLEAHLEGWDIFYNDSTGVLEVQRIDVPEEFTELAESGVTKPLFESDDAALKHVAFSAAAGSRMHLLALYLDGRAPGKVCQFVPDWLLHGSRNVHNEDS